tara:strand:- start:647 stop:970 length:324 start_codon:yes stop_codon:yes gene_type:complete
MKDFNLEKALAGEKVLYHCGPEVTQFAVFKITGCNVICGVINDVFCSGLSESDLSMAPTQLSGFINEYAIHTPTWHSTREAADMDFKTKEKRLACIDLSQFEEGHGL